MTDDDAPEGRADDPQAVMLRIREIQRSLTELQQEVIQGKIPPQEYMEEERRRVAEIHKLEERLAELMGDPSVNPRA